MTVKEQIIRKTIKEINKRLKKIDFILDATPLSDIIELEIETIRTAKTLSNEKAVIYLNQQLKKKNALLELAKKHAKLFNAKLLVVFSSEGGKGEKPEQISKIKLELDQIKEDLQKAGIDAEVDQLARGLSPGEDMVMYADENHIDQIYVGIRKKSRTSKLILGSTAQYIILKAKCPVTSVKT